MCYLHAADRLFILFSETISYKIKQKKCSMFIYKKYFLLFLITIYKLIIKKSSRYARSEKLKYFLFIYLFSNEKRYYLFLSFLSLCSILNFYINLMRLYLLMKKEIYLNIKLLSHHCKNDARNESKGMMLKQKQIPFTMMITYYSLLYFVSISPKLINPFSYLSNNLIT